MTQTKQPPANPARFKTEVAVTGPNGGPVQSVSATVEIPANDPIEMTVVCDVYVGIA